MSIRNGTRIDTVKSVFASVSDVAKAMHAKMEASSLHNGDAEKLGLIAYTATDVANHLDINPQRAGFIIPYPGIDGVFRDGYFYRFRYLEYKDQSGLGAITEDPVKKLRYMQPPESTNELYFPPTLKDFTWLGVAKDTGQFILITEGELKAACACKHGFPTIGLGGVDCWQKGKKALPQFDEILWENRKVTICFDSDAANNPHVVRAQNALAAELLSRGAYVFIAHLPHMASGAKCGIDDYLYNLDAASFQTSVLDQAEEFTASRVLHELNETIRYVLRPPTILHIPTLQLVPPKTCSDHFLATLRFTEIKNVVNKNGDTSTVKVDKCAVSEWVKWPYRSTINAITYEPGKAQDEGGNFNMWPGWPLEPVEGDVSLWHELLGHLFMGTPEADLDWFQKWLAYPIQFPGAKLTTAVVMWGLIHGAGKSTVGYTMMKMYGENASEIKDSDLNGTFNEWAKHKQFVMADEITGGDKRVASDRMKSIITQEWVRINAKYQPSYPVRDCINYFFTSNHPDAFFLEDTDRRFFVHEVKTAPLSENFYKEYHRWRDKLIDGQPLGAQNLFHYLKNLPLGDFNPNAHAPDTASKLAMIDDGRSDVGSWVAWLKSDPENVLRITPSSPPMKWTLATVEELHKFYDPEGKRKVTAGGVAREMKRQGFQRVAEGRQIKLSSGRKVLLWGLRINSDALYYATDGELAALYETEHKTNVVDTRERKY